MEFWAAAAVEFRIFGHLRSFVLFCHFLYLLRLHALSDLGQDMLGPDITAISCVDKQVWFAVFRDPFASVGVSFRLRNSNALSARRTRREMELARPIICRHLRSAPSTVRPRLSVPPWVPKKEVDDDLRIPSKYSLTFGTG